MTRSYAIGRTVIVAMRKSYLVSCHTYRETGRPPYFFVVHTAGETSVFYEQVYQGEERYETIIQALAAGERYVLSTYGESSEHNQD